MALAFVRSFFTITLFSTWVISVPLDYKDPETWFQNEESNKISGSEGSPAAAFQILVTSPAPSDTEPLENIASSPRSTAFNTLSTTPWTEPFTASTTPSIVPETTFVSSTFTSPPPSPSSTVLISTSRQPPTSTTTARPPTTPTAVSIIPSSNQNLVYPIPINPGNSIVIICNPSTGISAVPIISSNPTPVSAAPVTTSFSTIPPSSTRISTTPTVFTSTRGIATTATPIRLRLKGVTLRNNQSQQKQPVIIINSQAFPMRPTNRPRGNRGRNNRRNCDECSRICTEDRPICTRPVASQPDDLDNLRGFASLCHMDCFNSCRRIRYEMVAEGRCGRIRDRIRPFGSKRRLNRDDLKRNQYNLDQGNDAIFVFSPETK